MATETFANLPSTTVSSGGTDAPAGGTPETWTVAASTSFPAAATGITQFHVSDPAQPTEVMVVTNVSGTTWTVTRGAESTTPVTHSAGFTIKQVVTAGALTGFLQSDMSLWLAPSGATGETFPRTEATAYFSGLTSEQVYVSAIPLPSGLPVNNITMMVGGTAFTTVNVTHGWYALLDSNRVVRAVTADQTSGNWGSTFTPVSLSVSSSAYTTTYGGLYYATMCITFTGGSGEFAGAAQPVGGVSGLAPILNGTSGAASTTTPPSLGGTLSSLVNVAADRFYAYTS